MRKVAIVGGGATKCGKREASWRDLVQEAGKAMFESVNNLSPKDVDSLSAPIWRALMLSQSAERTQLTNIT